MPAHSNNGRDSAPQSAPQNGPPNNSTETGAEVDVDNRVTTHGRRSPRIAYVLKKYPRLSETFILNEVLGVEATGASVDVFSLRPPDDDFLQHAVLGRGGQAEQGCHGGPKESFCSGLRSSVHSGSSLLYLCWTDLQGLTIYL